MAVAPASAYVDPTSIVIISSPVSVMTGAVVSTTFTVLVTCTAEFPLESDTL